METVCPSWTNERIPGRRTRGSAQPPTRHLDARSQKFTVRTANFMANKMGGVRAFKKGDDWQGRCGKASPDFRGSAAEVVSLLVSTTVKHLSFERSSRVFCVSYYLVVTNQAAHPADLDRWIDETIIAFIVQFLLIFGVAQTSVLACLLTRSAPPTRPITT